MHTDWLPELTDDDLDTLIDALEAWELKDASGEMFADIVGAMIMRGDPRAMADLDAQKEKGKQQRERAKALRKERSVLLRAKLLILRDRRRVEQTIRRLQPQSVDAVDPPATSTGKLSTRDNKSS